MNDDKLSADDLRDVLLATRAVVNRIKGGE